MDSKMKEKKPLPKCNFRMLSVQEETQTVASVKLGQTGYQQPESIG
jgi:hypothetical protein